MSEKQDLHMWLASIGILAGLAVAALITYLLISPGRPSYAPVPITGVASAVTPLGAVRTRAVPVVVEGDHTAAAPTTVTITLDVAQIDEGIKALEVAIQRGLQP
jgi:hypothetical protein